MMTATKPIDTRTTPAAAGWLARGLALALPALLLGGGCGGSKPAPQPAQPAAEDDYEPSARRVSAPDIGEEDDDGLAVSGLRGRLETYDIQQGVQPQAGDLERCFTDQRRRRPYLGGDVELAFVVGPDGAVTGVHASRSDLGSWPVEKCLIEVGHEMRFPEPKGGAAAEFSLPLQFPARRAAAAWDEARATTEAAAPAAELATCGETAPAPEAAVWVTLYVGTRGQVQSVGFASPEAAFDHDWATCVEELILAWTLSDPEGRVSKMSFPYPLPEVTP